jgi:hypothetical protein
MSTSCRSQPPTRPSCNLQQQEKRQQDPGRGATAPAPSRTASSASDSTDSDGNAHAADVRDARDPAHFARRVAAWREFWQASLQASQLISEVERKGVQQKVLASEMRRLRAKLDLLGEVGDATSINKCRARYAQASAKLADAQYTASLLAARARILRKEADELQARAQRVL